MNMKKLIQQMLGSVLVTGITLLSASSAMAAETYDLVILDGRVMDPQTNFDGKRNVGVKDGKIVSITKDKIEGKEVIDAKGHVVAPGFIDTHVHVVDIPFGQKLMLRDGVTTPLDLEVGAYPVDRFYDTLNSQFPGQPRRDCSRRLVSVKRCLIPSTTQRRAISSPICSSPVNSLSST